jgi:hypothetical protein
MLSGSIAIAGGILAASASSSLDRDGDVLLG